MFPSSIAERVLNAYQTVRRELLFNRTPDGHWEGQLSTSALSTATAVMALEMVRRNGTDESRFRDLIDNGVNWLARHQNLGDGGWGDTTKSVSNISTTMLAHAAFHATGTAQQYYSVVTVADAYIKRAGGVQAVIERYGKDRTFSIPILTHCALAGLVDWKDVLPLPFELACVPANFYKTVRLPVVSYALPALIAIGQVRHHFRKPWNPLIRFVRDRAIGKSLQVLEKTQPSNGGFLEAAPLTSFVTMSLAGMGRADHPVACRGVQFLLDSVRPDGSWPIDTNLATWGTTLAVNALQTDLPEPLRPAIRDWLLQQQYREVHPYTNADPGGWAWTNLPGGVPDADDTPGAMLAILNLRNASAAEPMPPEEAHALQNAAIWLLDLQNRDGGWPTFCKGWGALPFDRSASDLTAHAIRALHAWLQAAGDAEIAQPLRQRATRAIERGFAYLTRSQRSDGSWLPLWFGNQFAENDENPVYGTTRVLAAFQDAGDVKCEVAQRGLTWLSQAQNDDGGWGGAVGVQSSVEETALAVTALVSAGIHDAVALRGANWLIERVEAGTHWETTPIGFYFAKLWYFEQLYPQVFITSALRAVNRVVNPTVDITGTEKTDDLLFQFAGSD